MQPFSLNTLDKRQTLTEKSVSLIRFSLSDNYLYDLTAKVRHFYDLYYLLQDNDCLLYLHSGQFCKDFQMLFAHDKETFDKPEGWRGKTLSQSPLLSDFPAVWQTLKETYNRELPAIAFSVIPNEQIVAKTFAEILQFVPKT